MLKEIKQQVYNDVKSDEDIQRRFPGSTQTPLWDNNLVNTKRASNTKPTPPNPNPNSNDKAIMKNALDKALAYISSTNADELERIKIKKKIEKAFAKNLIVKIMSQDGDIVVDREPISTFLGRISTDSGLIMHVSVVDFDMSQDGLITSLSVREIINKNKKRTTKKSN